MSHVDEKTRRPRREEMDFLERLSELDRNLAAASDPADAEAAVDAWAEFAERRPSSPVPARPAPPMRTPAAHGSDRRPRLGLFPPEEQTDTPATVERDDRYDEEARSLSPRRFAVLAAAFFLLMAAGAAVAAYIFRHELAAILATWQQR